MNSGFQTLLQKQIKDKRKKEKRDSSSKGNSYIGKGVSNVANSGTYQPLSNKKNVHFEEQAQKKVLSNMISN